MRVYQRQHGFYCGVDLHTRTMHVCVVDADGVTQEHVNLPCDARRFLKLIAPYREQRVVSCECLFAWYWLVLSCPHPTSNLTTNLTTCRRHASQHPLKRRNGEGCNT